jgi:two-component system cell cycle response regulator DivK
MPSVLLIEDNPDERRMYASLLYYNGFDVVEAKDAISGLQMARAKRPDAILMDVMLPAMSGLIAAQILAARHDTSHIPVVCMTGLMNITAEHARAAGCAALLHKPVRNHELVNTVRRCVEAGGAGAPDEPLDAR